MSAWAATDPSKAIQWWNSLADGATKDQFAKSLIQGVATQNVRLAWDCMQAFPVPERKQFMGTLVRQQVADQGAAQAAKWLADLSDNTGTLGQEELGLLRQKGFEALCGTMTTFSPKEKSSYISQFAQAPWMSSTGLAQRVAKDWAGTDGPATMAWTDTLPSQVRQQTLYPALAEWHKLDPTAAQNWIFQHPDDIQVQAAAARIGAP